MTGPARERRTHPSAPCALRCRARWIPAFAGMTGAMRWNDGAVSYAGAYARERRTHPSAPCALRCRARWIPAFAGMTGAMRWNDEAHPSARLHPPPSSTQGAPSFLAWIPAFAGMTGPARGRRAHPSAPCALRCRARWIPAFAGMTGAMRWNDEAHPSARLHPPLLSLPSLRGGLHPHPNLLPSREKGPEPSQGTTKLSVRPGRPGRGWLESG